MNAIIDYVLLAAHVFVLCFHILDMIFSHKKFSAICDKCGNTVSVSPESHRVTTFDKFDDVSCKLLQDFIIHYTSKDNSFLSSNQLSCLDSFIRSLDGDHNG